MMIINYLFYKLFNWEMTKFEILFKLLIVHSVLYTINTYIFELSIGVSVLISYFGGTIFILFNHYFQKTETDDGR